MVIQANRPQRPTDLKLEKSSRSSTPHSSSTLSTDQATRSVQSPESVFTGSKTKKSKSTSVSLKTATADPDGTCW